MTDQTTPAEPHDYLAAMQAEYNAKPLTERLLDYFDESDMECLPPVILEALAKLADAEQARDEAIRVAGANAVAYDEARAETRRLGVSLAETIQERQQLRTRLADADRERRAALDVAADLTGERDQARAVLAAALDAPTGAPLDDRRSSLDRARDILAREAAQEPPTATGGPGPDPSKGTGVPGLEIPAQTIDGRPLGAIEIISRTLVLMCGTSGHDRDEIREIAAALDATLRDVHYRDDAQRLRDTATTRAASAPDAVAYQRAVGIHEAADWLDARSAHEIEAREQTAAAPVVDGWTIYPTTDGGLMVSHDTDADLPTLAADDSIPIAAVLAFIADTDEEAPEPAEDHPSGCCGTCDAIRADREARESEPAEPTLRDIMAAAHRAGLGVRRDGDYIERDGNGEAWAYVEWSIVNGHGREVGRIGIEEGGSAYVWIGTRPGKPAQQYLTDPTPADILTAAREAGLIGDTDA